jgi:hypothetical protein
LGLRGVRSWRTARPTRQQTTGARLGADLSTLITARTWGLGAAPPFGVLCGEMRCKPIFGLFFDLQIDQRQPLFLFIRLG